jgi:uncharacterized damage-inducible protein DinB
MKQYLADYFAYNDKANRLLLETIAVMPDKTEALRLFSHLIHSQDKWHNRVTNASDDNTYAWFGTAFSDTEVGSKWDESYQRWQILLEDTAEADLEQYVYFIRPADGKRMKVMLKDVIFQLNCHGIHHRAQIHKLISAQGLPVPPTDFIRMAIVEAD